MDSQSAILTEEHLAQLNNSIDQAQQIEREIALAKQAGIDVHAAEASLQESIAKIRRIKAVYFPGR